MRWFPSVIYVLKDRSSGWLVENECVKQSVVIVWKLFGSQFRSLVPGSHMCHCELNVCDFVCGLLV